MTLFEIDNNIRNFLDELNQSVNEDGEIVDIDISVLDGLNEERENKIESIALYIKEIEAEILAIANEIKSFTERKKRLENKVESLKKYLTNSLLMNGDNKFERPRVRISFRKSEKLNVFDTEKLDKKYLIQEVTFKPDNKQIKEDIKNGINVSGACIIENQNIQIK